MEIILNKSNITKKEKVLCEQLVNRFFNSTNEEERESLLDEALQLDPTNTNILVQYGMKLINTQNKIKEFYGYMMLEKAFHTEQSIPIDCYQGKWLATMIGRYNHLLHKYKTSEKFFTLANSSKNNPDDTNNVQLTTCISGFPESVKHAQNIINNYNKRVDELLKKNINISFIPHSSYDFLILSAFNFEIYYEANLKLCMYKHYLLSKKMYPKLHYISPKIKQEKPGFPYKLGIASAFFTKNNSVIADFGGVIERLPRDKFDITFIHIYENGKNESDATFIYPDEKYVIINTDKYQNEEWLNDSRRKIEELQLDLLFYLDSTMSSVIQRIMMSKLAPKQAVSHGHPVTSGIPSNIMNYYISWAEAEIETAQEHYTENLLLLRKGHMHQYYKPRIDSNGNSVISGKPYSFINREYFEKYGLTADGNWYTCMQKPFKLHPEFDDFLLKIALRDESAKIILHKPDHDEVLDIFKKRLKKCINKVYFIPALPHNELMGLYNVSDVILDSYYAGGCTTTREALEIGSIVVTLPGKYLGGRWSLAYYNIIGITDLIAKNKDAYVDIALLYGKKKEEQLRMKQKILDNIHKIFYSNEAVNSWIQVFETIIHDR